MAFDFLDINETVVADGLEGKIFMIFGGNNLGKSLQGSQFPKPIFLPLEAGLNAIGGANQLKVTDWASFKDFTNSMTKEKATYERMLKSDGEIEKSKFYQFKQRCDTLVPDSLTALGKSCEKYVVDSADVQELSEIGHGKLYKRFENEFYRTVNDFMNLGFTILWIAHEDTINIGDEDDPIMKKIPKGDWKRVVKPVIDRCDIVAYLKSNGVDENGKVIKSSAYLAETDEHFARTKWDNMATYIEEFTAENLRKVLENAITEQKASGVKVGTYSEQIKTTSKKLDFQQIKTEILDLANEIYVFDKEDLNGENMVRYFDIVKEHLGDEMNVKDSKPKQVSQLSLILSEIKDLAEELGL